jgi:hypothetical protein
MRTRSFFLCLTFISISFVPVVCQNYLVFDNIPKSKRYRFQAGDEFSFGTMSQSNMATSVLTEIGDNYVVFDHLDNVRIDQISYVNIHKNGPWSGVRDVTGYVVPVIGVGYFAIETISNVSNGFEPYVRTQTLGVAIISVAYGVFMYTLKRRTYKVNQNHKLFTINLGPGDIAPFENK